MKEKLRQKNGITLIALVITIIVLLILAGISIAMLTGDNGILTQANKAKIETRGASVQEVRDLWFMEKKIDTTKSLDEVLQELRKKDLLTDKEVEEVKETGQVTIGSRTIVFGKNVELVAKVIYDKEIDKYAIAVGFKEYQVNSDFKSKIEVTEERVLEYIRNRTQEEQEKLCLEIFEFRGLKFQTIEEVFKAAYEEGATSKLCTTLNELTTELGANSVEEYFFAICSKKEFWEEKLNENQTQEHINGKIIDPSGNKTEISTNNIDPGSDGTELFSSYAYFYEITENGSYSFSFLGNDGQTGSITVTIDESNPCIVFDKWFSSVTLIAGIDNFISPNTAKVENAIYRQGYTGPENFDITDRIEEINNNDHELFPAGAKVLELDSGKYFDANVILTYAGKEYATKVDFWIAQ